MEKQWRGRVFAKVPTKLKSALKLKLVLLLSQVLMNADDSESANWRVFRGFNGIYVIAPNGNYYRLKLKLVLLLARAIASADDSGLADWRIFRGAEGIYTIAPNGNYYRININSKGELKLYRGKNRIYVGRRLKQGYFEVFKSSVSPLL